MTPSFLDDFWSWLSWLSWHLWRGPFLCTSKLSCLRSRVCRVRQWMSKRAFQSWQNGCELGVPTSTRPDLTSCEVREVSEMLDSFHVLRWTMINLRCWWNLMDLPDIYWYLKKCQTNRVQSWSLRPWVWLELTRVWRQRPNAAVWLWKTSARGNSCWKSRWVAASQWYQALSILSHKRLKWTCQLWFWFTCCTIHIYIYIYIHM